MEVRHGAQNTPQYFGVVTACPHSDTPPPIVMRAELYVGGITHILLLCLPSSKIGPYLSSTEGVVEMTASQLAILPA